MRTLSRWRTTGTSGPLSRTVMMVWLVAASLWLGWPVWSSLTAPNRAELEAGTTWVLAALLALLLLLGWGLWFDSGRRFEALSPVAMLVLAAVTIRLALNPQGSGVEFVFLAPLLAGMVLGSPAGVLTGALGAALSAVVTETVAAPLPGQMLVWGLWGLVGGWLHRLPTTAAWLGGVIACLPLGVASGVLLNLTGWATEDGVTAGAFIPGLGPPGQAAALWDHTMATSAAWDVTRGVATAAVLAVLGLPLLRHLRGVWGARRDLTDRAPTSAPIPLPALRRREAARTLEHLWTHASPEGDADAQPPHSR